MTKILIDRAVAEQALEALEAFLSDELRPYEAAKTAAALHAALVEPEQDLALQWGAAPVRIELGSSPNGWREAFLPLGKDNTLRLLAETEALPLVENALRAALAEPPKPASLKRGTTGRCTRKVCECEKEGLGLECIHLEPVVDGYPLWSGIPKAEPVQEPVAWLSTDCIGERYLGFSKPLDNDPVQPLYTAPPQRKPLSEREIDVLFYDWNSHCYGDPVQSHRRFARAIEAAHKIGGEA